MIQWMEHSILPVMAAWLGEIFSLRMELLMMIGLHRYFCQQISF
jgi:hypothetical protein